MDGGGLEAFVEACLHSPEFGERMLWLANDLFLTRTDFVEYFMSSYNYNDKPTRWDVVRSVGEEPLRLYQYIVENDRPLTDLVAADYTVADSTLAWFWGISYAGPVQGSAWLPGRYRDGRDHAGVLSQTSFYYRYPSTPSNKHRGRANQITRIFLDDDHFLRDVALELRRGADQNEDLDNAIMTSPGCISCHSSLDGIAAHLNGFALGPDRHSLYARVNFSHFSPQGVERWPMVHQRGMAYYGYPSRGLRDLGQYIARDPRFATTLTKHILRFLLHRNLDYRDRDRIERFSRVLVDSGYNTRALIKAIVLSEEYRTVGTPGGAPLEKSAALGKGAVLEGEPAPLPLGEYAALTAALLQSLDAEVEDATERARRERFLLSHAPAAARGASVKADRKASGGDRLATAAQVQPFKLATPEQLHALGRQLTGETWDGNEGGMRETADFGALEYNTGIKVAAGGYDGFLILERRWTVSPTYMLVLARWAEVLADDIYDRELRYSVPWSARRIFTRITGKEDPLEAEPAVRQQIADWFLRFYSEEVDPWSPAVDDAFGMLLLAWTESGSSPGSRNIRAAWEQTLALLLSDPRVAMY